MTRQSEGLNYETHVEADGLAWRVVGRVAGVEIAHGGTEHSNAAARKAKNDVEKDLDKRRTIRIRRGR